MATPYSKIYKKFLNGITDFNFSNFDEKTLKSMFVGWLGTAIVNTRSTTDLSKRDDNNELFDNDLTDLDVELLAMGMTLAWIDQSLRSTDLILMMVGGKEEKYYSQSEHIKQLGKMREDIKLEMKRLHSYDTYKNGSYFKE
jgi:hypothetical protein